MIASIAQVNPTAQLMLLQSRAHHEDRVIHSRATVDNKLTDFSRLLHPSIPSKKAYLNKEKNKKINQENVSLLSKIYKITFDKPNEGPGKLAPIPKKPRKEDGTNIDLHPFSSDHRSRSLNNAMRRKELDKINKDNSQLLYKLRTMKPTVPDVSECKQRKKQLGYLKQLLHKRDEERPTRVLQPYINQRMKVDSILYQYVQRHEHPSRRSSLITPNESVVYIANESNMSSNNIKIKKGRKNKRAKSRENVMDESRDIGHRLNASEIVMRSVEPSLLENNYDSNYKTNPDKKTIEELDKNTNLNNSQDAPAEEIEVGEEVEPDMLKSIKENDIKEEISQREEASNRRKDGRTQKQLNRTNPNC